MAQISRSFLGAPGKQTLASWQHCIEYNTTSARLSVRAEVWGERPPPHKKTTFRLKEKTLRFGALRPNYYLPSDSTSSSNCVLCPYSFDPPVVTTSASPSLLPSLFRLETPLRHEDLGPFHLWPSSFLPSPSAFPSVWSQEPTTHTYPW